MTWSSISNDENSFKKSDVQNLVIGFVFLLKVENKERKKNPWDQLYDLCHHHHDFFTKKNVYNKPYSGFKQKHDNRGIQDWWIDHFWDHHNQNLDDPNSAQVLIHGYSRPSKCHF